MITGRVPFPQPSLPEKLYAHQLHDPDPLAEVAPGTPEPLAEVIRKMMRKRPEERHQTPLEVAQALEPFAIESGWTTTPPASASTSGSVAVMSTLQASRPPASTGADLVDKRAEGAVQVAESPTPWAAGLNLDLGPASKTPASASGSGSNSGAGVGESFFPLDLVRDEPLFEGLNPPSKPKKPKVKPEPKPKPPVDPEFAAGRPAWRPPSRGVALAAIGTLAVVLVVGVVALLATMALSGPGFGKKVDANSTASKTKVVKKVARGDIVVLYKDGESEAVKSLTEALAMASSKAGAEVLLGGTTVRIDNGKTIRVADGSLTIRAVEGARPVLEVKVKGPQPMFLVNANLRLEGLTVVVKYETASAAPIFQAERDLIMNRCTFRADGPTEGSRFALAEGRKAVVDGCLFEGFETALHVEANAGMAARMHSFYLRNMYRRNKLAEPDGISLDGVPIDLGRITIPAYFLSTREDHIAPWRTTYHGTQLLQGPTRFILAASGHIAGVVNPAGRWQIQPLDQRRPAGAVGGLAGRRHGNGRLLVAGLATLGDQPGP